MSHLCNTPLGLFACLLMEMSHHMMAIFRHCLKIMVKKTLSGSLLNTIAFALESSSSPDNQISNASYSVGS